MRHTHVDVGEDAPLTHRRVCRQLKLFGHDSVDAVHSQPPSEQVSPRILRHTTEMSLPTPTLSWPFGLTLMVMLTGLWLGFQSGRRDTTLILTTCPGQ